MTLEATQNAKSKLEKQQLFRPLSASLRSDNLMPWLRNEVNSTLLLLQAAHNWKQFTYTLTT